MEQKNSFDKKLLIALNLYLIGHLFFFLEKSNGDIREAWLAFYVFVIVLPTILIVLPKCMFESKENNEDENMEKLKDNTYELVEKRTQEIN